MIRKKVMSKEIVIDLTGPDGNAFAIMGYAKKLSRQLGIDSKPILEEMMSGNYNHLIATFDKHFGDYVVLEN
jgi:hypothetical protein